MKLLVLTGNLYPIPGNNANLLSKLVPYLAEKHEVQLLSTVILENTDDYPSLFRGFPVYWISKTSTSFVRHNVIYPVVSKLFDANGNSDLLNALYIKETLRRIKKTYPYDVVISSSEPYPAVIATAREYRKKKILYLMDPPAFISDDSGTRFRNKSLRKVLYAQDVILTTPFIKKALIEKGFCFPHNMCIDVGFPMVERHNEENRDYCQKDTIKLLFCGWMCDSLRSPSFFLQIVSFLDERFQITFMGKECDTFLERYSLETKANIITLPNQPYDVALRAMAEADIMINIGNNVPVHMPSKTLEYINTGKPLVNFYKFKGCPTLHYTKRFPLAFNIYEGNKDIVSVADSFINFCVKNKGKCVNRNFIESTYEDCTPQYIAQKIIESLEK